MTPDARSATPAAVSSLPIIDPLSTHTMMPAIRMQTPEPTIRSAVTRRRLIAMPLILPDGRGEKSWGVRQRLALWATVTTAVTAHHGCHQSHEDRD